MRFELIRLEKAHINELIKIMGNAFDKDIRAHLGEEKGGLEERI